MRYAYTISARKFINACNFNFSLGEAISKSRIVYNASFSNIYPVMRIRIACPWRYKMLREAEYIIFCHDY